MHRIPLVAASLLLIGSTFVIGCDFAGERDRNDLSRLEAEILTMIGSAGATDVAFCRQIAFGSKPCGGPWRYLAYSTAVTRQHSAG